MGEETTDPKPDAEPKPAERKPIVHMGKEVKLSEEERLRYEQIGYNDEFRRAELKALKERVQAQLQELDGKKGQLKVVDHMLEIQRTDPETFELIEKMYSGKLRANQLLAARKAAAQDQGDGDDDAALPAPAPTRASEDPQIRALLERMAARIESVESRTKAFDEAQNQRAREQAMEAALARDPYLSTKPAAKEMALREMRRLMDSEELDLDQATTVTSTALRAIAGDEEATRKRDELKHRQDDLRAIAPSRGLPPTRDFSPDVKKGPDGKPLSQRDVWKRTREGAINYLRSAISQAQSGPQ